MGRGRASITYPPPPLGFRSNQDRGVPIRPHPSSSVVPPHPAPLEMTACCPIAGVRVIYSDRGQELTPGAFRTVMALLTIRQDAVLPPGVDDDPTCPHYLKAPREHCHRVPASGLCLVPHVRERRCNTASSVGYARLVPVVGPKRYCFVLFVLCFALLVRDART